MKAVRNPHGTARVKNREARTWLAYGPLPGNVALGSRRQGSLSLSSARRCTIRPLNHPANVISSDGRGQRGDTSNRDRCCVCGARRTTALRLSTKGAVTQAGRESVRGVGAAAAAAVGVATTRNHTKRFAEPAGRGRGRNARHSAHALAPSSSLLFSPAMPVSLAPTALAARLTLHGRYSPV